MTFDYFYGNEAEQFTFYRIPKLLITSPHFKKLSDSAKLLYGLMLDRMSLSLKNGWVDERNRAYIYFKTDDVMEQMCCAAEKATKLLAELDSVKGIGLIERVKQGQGKPARIYLKKFTARTESQDFRQSKNKTFGNRNSRVSECEKSDFRQSKSNNNDINNNKNNKTELNNINLSTEWIDGYKNEVEKIKAQIDYDSLCLSHGAEVIDEIVNIMAEVMTVDAPYYRIEGRNYPADLVREMFGKITYGKLEAFLLEFGSLADKIRNPKAYLISALFNIPSTADTALLNRVNHDLSVRKNE